MMSDESARQDFAGLNATSVRTCHHSCFCLGASDIPKGKQSSVLHWQRCAEIQEALSEAGNECLRSIMIDRHFCTLGRSMPYKCCSARRKHVHHPHVRMISSFLECTSFTLISQGMTIKEAIGNHARGKWRPKQ